MYIKIGARSYDLKYTYNSLCELEALMGVNLQLIRIEDFGISAIRALLKAGCKEIGSLEEAGDLIQEHGDLKRLTGILVEALKQSGVLASQQQGPKNTEKKTYRKN